jgi:tRNA-modifying protein YgfZ
MRILRDAVTVAGPEATSFLQGQLSQDIEPVGAGESTWAFLLQPQGKVDAWLRVNRLGDTDFVLDVDAGFGVAVVERLERFKLRVKADITMLGTRAIEVDETAPVDEPLAVFGPLDLDAAAEADDGWEQQWTRVRVDRGLPAMGRELTGETIPEEVGLVDASVSFTKGCYTGQELVARIDSRGRNVPRRLRRVEADRDLRERAELTSDGKTVGAVTSASGPVGLALVGRSVTPPAEIVVDGGVARIEALPPLR